ncbi:hypothetical protein H1O16_gp339 [Burkholderia phage BcepSaruman]|uniref:Uncharacterized protein n=1 Tax=Burkholderia phage BcepSaruman TaxID=2530032 RepID=A0A4D5ZGX0_9CAUD|nr:hypothetical protein H1O16_gp339 [Burkholderia phage BcepSaruman]QBX06752.1 hypothetical protein BcepSaruman_339 [Burkholderia phage BcepSaruman]
MNKYAAEFFGKFHYAVTVGYDRADGGPFQFNDGICENFSVYLRRVGVPGIIKDAYMRALKDAFQFNGQDRVFPFNPGRMAEYSEEVLTNKVYKNEERLAFLRNMVNDYDLVEHRVVPNLLDHYFRELDTWLDVSAEGQRRFRNYTGICTNVEHWLQSHGVDDFALTCNMRNQLTQEFQIALSARDEGVYDGYPFNANVGHYLKEAQACTIYDNAERVAYIRRRAARAYLNTSTIDAFLTEFRQWFTNGRAADNTFSSAAAVCSNLTRWMRSTGADDFACTWAQKNLMEKFVRMGLHARFPFNERAMEYADERDAGTFYKNPKRCAWIEKMGIISHAELCKQFGE